MDEAEQAVDTTAAVGKLVKHFRQILLWPVYLLPLDNGLDIQDYWSCIAQENPDNPWHEVEDEFTGDPADFQERHYNEFVAFLPPVQRFLWGQGIGKSVRRTYGDSAIRVMRRADIASVRVTLDEHPVPLVFKIAHVDLYFFFDIDVAMMALEIHADDLPLAVCQEMLFQFGRAYPAFWEAGDRAGDCPRLVEWLDEDGAVLAQSDYDNRSKFLTFTGRHRAPCVAAHWEYLLRPMVLHHTDLKGPIRYRQLEYYRMPLMAYLAMENPAELTTADNIRLALATGAGDSGELPFSDARCSDFERKHGYDRFHELRDGRAWTSSRYWTCGHALVVTGDGCNSAFTDLERGTLSRFRHQHFLLFMIAHFHKAALLMFSDRLAAAVSRLDVRNEAAVLTFRRETRRALEAFLRFTHRYWFHEVSDQAQVRDLFDLCRGHLEIDRLYDDIREEVQDMSQYLEAEATRRQNDSVMRLTVVTIFGLVGTVATGFLGMNLFGYADEDPLTKLLLFIAVFVPTTALSLYTVKKSRRLAGFLDALADDRMPTADKWRAFKRVW